MTKTLSEPALHNARVINDRTRDYLTAALFGFVALLTRLWHLQLPKGFVFDEVYYAQNAHSLLQHGVELDPIKKTAEFIVHPPVGKWMIAIGIKLFGFHEFGWRASAAIVGAISIVLIYFVAKELFNSYFLSVTAGVLMSADGLHLVMSRTALLDIFLMFFILLGFYFLLTSHHYLAGIALGLASATKWSGLYFLVAYLTFILYVDYRQNRSLEIEHPIRRTVLNTLLKRIAQYLVIPALVYFASWIGWFTSSTGYDRNWAKGRSGSFFDFIPGVLRSWWHYHAEILNFHTHLTDSHPYAANPWSWLIMGRPTSFFYAAPKGAHACGGASCAQEVLALGTPLLWWSGVIAIGITFGYWIARREWQSGLLLLSLAAGYLPWFMWQKRTIFCFYVIAFEPFIILIIVYVLKLFLEPRSVETEKRWRIPQVRRWLCYGYILVIVANFFYFFPLFMGSTITYAHWSQLMWLESWI